MPFDAGLLKITPEELRQKLDKAGYDVSAIDGLGETIGVDLYPILAAWAPITAGLLIENANVIPLPIPKRIPWWKRVWKWIITYV